MSTHNYNDQISALESMHYLIVQRSRTPSDDLHVSSWRQLSCDSFATLHLYNICIKYSGHPQHILLWNDKLVYIYSYRKY